MSACSDDLPATFRGCRQPWRSQRSGAINGTRCPDRIYPPAHSVKRRAATRTSLSDTRCAQPAIGAVSLGLLRILDDFGVRPDVTGGHSFGELTALCAAGWIDDRALARLPKHAVR